MLHGRQPAFGCPQRGGQQHREDIAALALARHRWRRPGVRRLPAPCACTTITSWSRPAPDPLGSTAGADALIIAGTWGCWRSICPHRAARQYPDRQPHPGKVKFLRDVGFSPGGAGPRALPCADPAKAPPRACVQLEFFIHGALCVSLQQPVQHQPRPHRAQRGLAAIAPSSVDCPVPCKRWRRCWWKTATCSP